MTLVTEKEAAEKWCPMFRVSVAMADQRGGEWATNRDRSADNNSDVHNRCIGSRCMAWRVKDKRHAETCEVVILARKAIVPKCNCAPQAIGYCGAFGKVEP